MKVSALRTWGIGVSGAMILSALVIAAQPSEQAAAQAQERGVFEIAQADASAAQSVAFLVRFRGTGPIARAQAQAARGQTTEAQRQIEFQLRRQRDFSGLCFERFTVGGAEVVLRTCAAIVASERAAVQQHWLTRLQAMRAVEYVDANATASRNAPG